MLFTGLCTELTCDVQYDFTVVPPLDKKVCCNYIYYIQTCSFGDLRTGLRFGKYLVFYKLIIYLYNNTTRK